MSIVWPRVNSFTPWGFHPIGRGWPHIWGPPPPDRERHYPLLLPADKNADVMAGAGTATLDHEANLTMESTNGRIKGQKLESLKTLGSTASTSRLPALKLVHATVTRFLSVT